MPKKAKKSPKKVMKKMPMKMPKMHDMGMAEAEFPKKKLGTKKKIAMLKKK